MMFREYLSGLRYKLVGNICQAACLRTEGINSFWSYSCLLRVGIGNISRQALATENSHKAVFPYRGNQDFDVVDYSSVEQPAQFGAFLG